MCLICGEHRGSGSSNVFPEEGEKKVEVVDVVERRWNAEVSAFTARILLRNGTMQMSRDFGCAPLSLVYASYLGAWSLQKLSHKSLVDITLAEVAYIGTLTAQALLRNTTMQMYQDFGCAPLPWISAPNLEAFTGVVAYSGKILST
jgi:hypothetical protein